MKLARAAIAALIALGAPASAAVPTTLPPIDQCRGDASFDRFRSALKSAVERTDQRALIELVAPDVEVNFGDKTGPAAFVEEWSFETDDPFAIWPLLKTMLTLGCARDGEARIIPSLDVQMDAYAAEVRKEVVLVLPGAKLYAEAGVEHEKPATVPWTLATVTSRAGDYFTGVRLPDGREGLVPDPDLYEPLSYRMFVEKIGDRWVITAFVVGE